MKKSGLLTAFVIIIILGGVFIFSRQPVKQEEEMVVKTPPAQLIVENSRYLEHSEGVLEQTADKRRVLFFYASWCPICRPADQSFKENAGKIPEDVILVRVNYNDPDTDRAEKDLAGKYGVTYQHTFVQIDQEGSAIHKWNGGEINELLANIK